MIKAFETMSAPRPISLRECLYKYLRKVPDEPRIPGYPNRRPSNSLMDWTQNGGSTASTAMAP